ncbi:hypothetical protein F5Y03DRAFT_405569 [Xylaria venustula]|nr:hypothetical protein F5Y03DRAFT_405569 [Xylaria venustula]
MPPTCYDAAEAQKNAGPPPDNSQYSKYEPPVFFFTDPPEYRPAVFSVCSRPFRYPENPTWHRSSGYWSATKIQETCDGLRQRMPDVCRAIKPIVDFWDLYGYFDGYDIYHRGAQNLYNVLTHLRIENEIVQDVVEREQEAQTKQHTPLFESLVADMMGDPTRQSRFLNWDEKKQPDILQAVATGDLQRFFEGYDKYPEHFLKAIRAVLRKRYDNSRNQDSAAAPTTENAHIDVTSRLDALLRDVENISNDPFMDKFDLPGNAPSNKIVIVNGSSATAALNAGYRPAIRASNQNQTKRNGAGESRPALNVPAEDGKRCQSAPIVIEGPDYPSINPAAVKSHLSEVDKIDWNEFMEQKKSNKPKATSHDLQITSPSALHAPESHSQSILPATNQSQPPIIYQNGHGQTTHYHGPSMPGVMSSPGFNPVPLPRLSNSSGEAPSASFPMPPPGRRHVPLPQSPNNSALNGAFANQLQPWHTMTPQWNHGPPPLMQQTQYPAPGFMQPNGAGYFMNANPPYVHSNIGQQYGAPAVHANGFGNARAHQNSVASNRVGGSWQPVGSDNIHGPKVVFLKDSVANQNGYMSNINLQRGSEYNGMSRRMSTGGSSGNARFNNPHTQYNGHPHPGQAGRSYVTETGSTPRSTSGEKRHLKNGCVNAGKWPRSTKFEPCPCSNCSQNDRTIYVFGFKQDALKPDVALQQVKNHFSKFGIVEKVVKANGYNNSARVRFATVHSAIAAVQGPPEQIHALDGVCPFVEHQIGSQFYKPRRFDNHVPISNKENHRDWNAHRDYSTVPVRHEKARDGIIGKEWAPSPQMMAPQNGHTSIAENSQTSQPTLSTGELQSTAGNTTANLQPENDKNKNSTEGQHSSENLDTHAHIKHKANEKVEGEEAPSQVPQKQEIPEVVQVNGRLPECQDARAMNGHDVQVTGQTKKKKNWKNKNKNHRHQGSESLAPTAYPATTNCESQTIGRMLPNGVEPFPLYKDVMSGSQFQVRGHSTGPGANLSVSSNESTVIQDSDRKPGNLNPGVQDSVPSPTHTSASSSTLKLSPPPFSKPIPTSQINGEASGSKTDTAPDTVIQNKKKGGRLEGEIKQDGGYPKQKNGKKSQKFQKSVDTQAPAEKGPDDSNAEDTALSSLVSTATLDNGSAQFDRKGESLCQDALQEAMQDELPNHSDPFLSKPPQDTETSTPQDSKSRGLPWLEKGKWKEGADLQKPRLVGSRARKDSKMETYESSRPESRTEIGTSETVKTSCPPAPAAVSCASSSASSTTIPARTESKYQRTNNFTNPKKGVGTQHSGAKTNGNKKKSKNGARTENTTSNGPSAKPHSGTAQPQASPKKSILNTEDFPALPPSKPAPSMPASAPRVMWPVAIPLVGPWTKNRAVSAQVSTSSSTAAATPTSTAPTTDGPASAATTSTAPAAATNPAVESEKQRE